MPKQNQSTVKTAAVSKKRFSVSVTEQQYTALQLIAAGGRIGLTAAEVAAHFITKGLDDAKYNDLFSPHMPARAPD